MCHSIKTLFYELGASPAIYELDKDPQGRDMEQALFGAFGSTQVVPAVFIGGRYVGSAKDIISFHVNGSLKQMLKDSKAIWFWLLLIRLHDIYIQLTSTHLLCYLVISDIFLSKFKL